MHPLCWELCCVVPHSAYFGWAKIYPDDVCASIKRYFEAVSEIYIAWSPWADLLKEQRALSFQCFTPIFKEKRWGREILEVK